MGMRRTPFQVDEWFHCYNRGIDKRTVFEQPANYERFVQLLCLINSEKILRRSDMLSHSTDEIMGIPRAKPLVSIGAYCLMPNHFHLLLREIKAGGIARFMQRLGTAYTMYFNVRNERTGNLFTKPFRSRHVGEDRYFQRVVNYIHCNPAELFEHGWKKGNVKNMDKLERMLRQYRYSSLADYAGDKRSLSAILGQDGFDAWDPVTPTKMLEDYRAYYADKSMDDAGI